MLFKSKALFLIASLFVSGCAIHPLPENVTPFDTYAIVRKIRCEARERVAKKAIGFLKASSSQKTRDFAEDLQSSRRSFKELLRAPLDIYTMKFVKKYSKTAIAYDFTFDMTEDNDIGAQVDFIRTFTNGAFNATVKAENDRMRETIRNFRISDTFEGLLTGPLDCFEANATAGANYLYPITGTIGLKEVIDTFIDLNEFQNLTYAKDDKEKVPVLADTFNFQTTITGSINPRVLLSPVTRGFMGASLTASASRKDIHKVIVALSLPVAKDSIARQGGGFFVPTTTISGKSGAEVRAIDEIYNQLLRNILFNLPQRVL